MGLQLIGLGVSHPSSSLGIAISNMQLLSSLQTIVKRIERLSVSSAE